MASNDRFSTENYLDDYYQAFGRLINNNLSNPMQMNGDGKAFAFPMDEETLQRQFGELSNVDMMGLMQKQFNLAQQHIQLWQSISSAMQSGEEPVPIVSEDSRDKRFQDPQWNDNPMYSYIKQSYLLNSQMLNQLLDSIKFEDEEKAKRARFFMRQAISAMAPTNSAITNPEVYLETVQSNGQNLVKGLENLTRDMQKSPMEALKVSQCDPDAFKLGVNLATTPGKVIFQNELIQLIQYEPSTPKVHAAPLLIIPPFINKFYILDLVEKKSMVRWLVEQGYTVFMASWVNPDVSLAATSFEDYVLKGVVASVDVVSDIYKTQKINAAGYCSGGTMLAVAQAYLRGKGDDRLKSCTFFAAQTDFSDAGDLGIYLSDELIPFLESHTNMKGIFDGRILAMGFNLLRENNLFWSYYVNNYLKGTTPDAFDIFHWNSDSTNIPAETMSFYIRKMYMANQLIEPGAIKIGGQAIELAAIDTPSYFIATIADHIVPWTASYRSSKYLSGKVRFVLGQSGHIAGIVNPAEEGKYNHWINDKPCPDMESWQKGATEVEGSWWNDWDQWLQPQSGNKVAARKVGSKKYPAIEDAPGSYVKVFI